MNDSAIPTIVALGLVVTAIGLSITAIRSRLSWLAAPAAVPLVVILIADALGSISAPIGLRVALIVALTALGVVGGSPIVALILKLATPDSATLGAHGGILVRDTTSPPPQRDKEVLRGGATIGYLERFALIGAVLVGQAAAVAIIVAIKGLGRFSELESSVARERFIIGTLASLVWASVTAAAAAAVW